MARFGSRRRWIVSWKIVFPTLEQYPALAEPDLRAFEARHHLVLPRDYVKFLLQYRGALPRLEDDQGRQRGAKFPVVWGDKPANAAGTECHLDATFSLFDGRPPGSPLRAGCDLDGNIARHAHLHPRSLLPVGTNAGKGLFMLGITGEVFGQVFFLSTGHVADPTSFDHIGFIALTFSAFLRSARPCSRDE
jgi:hypothetical protein